jgi:tetratricopeptide (TPR) repeat protein
MRLGELLVESQFVTARQLSSGLEYARAKGLPLGQVLKLLHVIDEPKLQMTLTAQRAVRGGASQQLTIDALKRAEHAGITFEQAFGLEELKKLALEAPMHPGALLRINEYATKSPQEATKIGDELLFDNKVEDAERAYDHARKAIERAAGTRTKELADVLTRLGHIYLLTDRLNEAEDVYEQALEIRGRALGPHDATVASSYEDLSDLYEIWSRVDLVKESLQKACDIRYENLPEGADKFATTIKRLVALCAKSMQPSKKQLGELLVATSLISEQQLKTSLQKAQQTQKPLGRVVREGSLVSEGDLQSLLAAQSMMKQGALAEPVAVEMLKVAFKLKMPFQDALRQFKVTGEDEDNEAFMALVFEQDRLLAAEASLGTDHPTVSQLAARLAEKYFDRKDMIEAEIFYKRAIGIWNKMTQVEEPLFAAKCCRNLAKVYTSTGRHLQAQALLIKALEMRNRAGAAETPEALVCLVELGQVEMAQENYATALSFLRSALALSEKLKQEDSRDTHLLYDLVGRCFFEAGQLDAAAKVRERLVATAQKVFGPADPETARSIEKLGDVYADQGNISKAEAQYNFALQILEHNLESAAAARDLAAKLKGLPKQA